MIRTYLSRSLLFLLCIFLLNQSLDGQVVLHLPERTPVGASTATRRITVWLERAGTVDQVKVVTRGPEGIDFQSTGDTCSRGTYAVGQSCTVDVVFKPTVAGDRQGAVLLLDSGKHMLAKQPLAATAMGAVATFIPGLITTVAGNSSIFFSGDGGLAVNAALFLPFGIDLDGAADLYIADTYNNRIRVVNAQTGVISTVAGNGSTGYTGDGGLAVATGLNNPSAVQLDAAGNIYIADTGNNAVRMVNALTGLISTVAGNGTAAYQGDGGQANAASLKSPNGVAFDANGNIYIADTGNNAIRFVNISTGVISTVAGNGLAAYRGDGTAATAASLNNPWAITITTAGALYIADQKNNAIRKVDTSGIITTIAGNGSSGATGDGGAASAALLNSPSGVLFDAAGNLYISDTGNNRVRKINPSSGIISVAAGTGGDGDSYPATQASLYGPYALALDGQGSLFLADAVHNRIRKISSNLDTLRYPTMRIGSVSAPMNQVLENDGTATLTISSITAGPNTQLDASTTCSAGLALAPLDQCTLAADFAPATTGGVTGSIVINSDGVNTPDTLRLQGTVQSTYPSTALLSSTPNPSIVGNGVLFSVQVINPGGTVPTGKVVLLDGTTTIANLTLANGIASVTISNLAIGQHTITAAYGGDVNNSSTTSLPINQVVNPVPLNSSTTTMLSSSANPITVGQILNLNATVAAVTAGQAVPTGTVAFMEGTTLLGTGTLNAGSASIGISTLAAGTHMITALYNGSSTYSGSTSSVLTQLVIALNSGTTTSLTASADPIAASLTLILTTTVSAVTTSQSTPTGTVNFMEGTTLLGTSTLASGGATFTISTLSVGTHLITAVYAGSASYATSTSPVLTEIVVAAGTGNSTQFTLKVKPPSLTLQSGSHATLQVSLTASANFTDTLSLGCGGLPIDATCTFSQTQVKIAGGSPSTLNVLVDTGNPLDAGPSAKLDRSSRPGPDAQKTGLLACILPGGALLAILLGGRRRKFNLLLLAITGCTLTVLSGCGSSYKVQTTPAGVYTFQVFANGTNSGSSYTVPVQLTVTK